MLRRARENAGGTDGSGSEAVAKHRQAALRFGFGRFILQNIPVFGEAAVLDPDKRTSRRRPRSVWLMRTGVDLQPSPSSFTGLRRDERLRLGMRS